MSKAQNPSLQGFYQFCLVNSYPVFKAQLKYSLPFLHAAHLMSLLQWVSAHGHAGFSAALWRPSSLPLEKLHGCCPLQSLLLTIPKQTVLTLQNSGSLDFTCKTSKIAQDPQGTLSVKHVQCVYLIPVCLPPWNVNSMGAGSVCLCLHLSSRVWYVEDSQYASAGWTPPP